MLSQACCVVEGRRRLVQVAADIASPATCEREIRALTEAGREFPDAAQVLVTETDPPLGMAVPKTVEIVPVWRFLL